MLHSKFTPAALSFVLLSGLSAFAGSAACAQADRKDLADNVAPVLSIGHTINPVQVTISQSDSADLRFRVYILNPEEQKITIYIKSKAFGTLLAKTLTNSEFSNHEYVNLYNLTELEDGQYSIEVIAGRESIRKDILINTTTRVDRRASMN
jgi:hypothetical protein